MTTLKDALFSRVAKACFAFLLAASLIPVSALASASAYAEDVEGDAAGATTEVEAAEALVYGAGGEAGDAAEAEETDGESTAEAALETTSEQEEPTETSSADEPSEPAAEGQVTEPAESTATPEVATDEATPAIVSSDTEGTLTELQLDTLETTVEEEGFSFFAPFRLLFGAADTFTVPLKSGTYEKWIDRLDLSGANQADGTNYATNFYNILAEACDNDGTADWLIDWGNPNVLNRNGHVGGVYQVPDQPAGTVGILAAIIPNNDTATSSALTATELRVKEYINETYGAFDRDYPTSFWRDIQFGTVFWRPSGTSQSYCLFVLRATDPKSTMDIRAQGYRSATDIRSAITKFNGYVSAIKAAYAQDDLAKSDSDYSRVKFYNKWLCANNQYNTSFPNIDQAANPDVWSAMSALEGRSGTVGPVCEGYARAMKVLCDSDDIGCVLVDGKTGAGPHMWNYVRMGSSWYGVDVTWNDSGAGASSSSYEQYLLKGSQPFETTHPATNQFMDNGTKFTNGPVLASSDYDPNSLTFAGAITGLGPFAYGDQIPLAYNSTTTGTVTYERVSGPATVVESSTLAQAAADGALSTLSITGTGSITVKVTLDPGAGGSKLTDTITITAVPRPLKTTGTVVASKVYDGTNAATVTTPGTLISARTEPAYASQVGVLAADEADIAVRLKADSAAFLNTNAGTNQAAVAAYELTSPTNNSSKLALYTLAGHETENTTGTITKRPVTAFFALTSSRVLTTEQLPGGTVRYEAANGDRGKLAGDDLQPPTANVRMTGMPATMPTDIATGDSRTYDVTWAMPNTGVLTEIAKSPAAGNYQVSLSTDTAENTVKLVIANLENTEVMDAQSPSGGGALYRVESRVNGINDETREALTASGYSDTRDIVAKLMEELRSQTTRALSDDRVIVYDMTLYVQDTKGEWVPATAANFPTEGVRVTVEYPKGTQGDTHSFFAAHMFTHEVASGGALHKPGEVEKPAVENAMDGLQFTLMGFSPVSVAWEDAPRTPTPVVDDGGNTTQASQSYASQNAAGNVAQTGDSLPVLTITVVALACIVLIVALMVRRSRDRKEEGADLHRSERR